MDTLLIQIDGLNVECQIVWNEGGAHVVARRLDYPFRLVIAKRKLGAWSEVPLAEAAAKLNRFN